MKGDRQMETSFIIGNIVSQAGLVTIAGILVKRWMDKVDKGLDDTREALKNNAILLTGQIEKVHVELKLANGRTAKLEGRIEEFSSERMGEWKTNTRGNLKMLMSVYTLTSMCFWLNERRI